MIKWSSKYTLAAGIALIIVTNAVVMFGVQYNRSREPDAGINLTERELTLPPYGYGFSRENSGLSLWLAWRVIGKDQRTDGSMSRYGSPTWLDKNKLAALGFEVTNDANTPEAKRRYQKMLPRGVLLVLEYDGEAYQQALNQAKQHLKEEEALLVGNPGKQEFVARVKRAQDALIREQQANSRLFVIDAGIDHGDLRARYTDRSRYIIARGQVRIMVESRAGEKSGINGYIQGVSIEGVNVPLEYRHVLDPFLANRRIPGPDALPRYAVKLNVGRRLEPWIADVSAM